MISSIRDLRYELATALAESDRREEALAELTSALTEEDHQTIEQRIWTRFSEALARSI